jgi:hypothetical protein
MTYSKKVRQMAARICDVMASAAEVPLYSAGNHDGTWDEDTFSVGLHLYGKDAEVYIQHTTDSETASNLANSVYYRVPYRGEEAPVWAEAAQLIREGWPRMEYVLTPVFPDKRSK